MRTSLERYAAGLRSADARQTTADRALTAHLNLFAQGNGSLLSVDGTVPDDPDRRNYPTGAALAIVSRLNDGRWDEAAEMVAACAQSAAVLGDEPYALLNARMLFYGLTRRRPPTPSSIVRTLRSLIAEGRVRHAVAAASWFIVAAHATAIDVPADLTSFIGDALDQTPMPYLFGGIPLAVVALEPYLGRERCLQALERRQRFASRWHRAHHDLAFGMLVQDTALLRSARDEFDALHIPGFAMLAGLQLNVPRASDIALAKITGLLPDRAPPGIPLSRRQRDVAELAATGATNREIAQRLRISERTVEVHLTNTYRKLSIHSRAGLAQAMLRIRGIES